MILRAAPRARLHRALMLLGLCVAFGAAAARAQVAGEQVTHGSASFQRSASTTTITAANNTIIRYSSFDIAAGQTVQFIQPSRTSRVLNWVNGSLPTNINGSLLANGQVYIANAAGVYFGAGSYVNAGALYVAGGSISNDDFLRGSNHFTNLTGSVRNDGTIEAGNVALVGRLVANHGSIYAPNGFVSLVSGDDIQLSEPGSAIIVSATNSKVGTPVGVENTGKIDAGSGSALLAAGDLYSVAISQSGTVRAGRITIDSGATGTSAVSGTLDARNTASGAKGGEIRVLGDVVQLADSAVVDASGTHGGGTLLVGGDAHGENAAIRNARVTTVNSGAVLSADAVESGNGGKVIVWADGYTGFAGTIFARGGATSGSGGFAEISGKGHLDLWGLADLRAPSGSVGTLLLDPTDITLVSGDHDASPGGSSFNGTTTLTFDAGNHDASTLYIGTDVNDSKTTLLKQLAGANVIVSTTSTGNGTGNITIDGAINYTSTNSLTFSAANNITVNQAVTNTTSGSLIFTAGNAITLNDNVSTTGHTTLSYAGQLSGTGRVTANSLTLSGAGNATNLNTSVTTLLLSKGSGSTTLTDTGSISLSGRAGDNLSVTAGSITVGGAVDAAGAISLNATGAITLNGTVDSSTATFSHGGLLSGSSRVTANSLSLAGTGSTSTLTTTIGALSLSKLGGNTSIDNTGTLALSGSTAGDLTVSTSGSITQPGLLSVSGDTSLTLTGQAYDVSLGSYANLFSGNVSINGASGGSVHDLNLRNAAGTTGTLSIPSSLNNLTLTYDNVSPNLDGLSSVNDLTVRSRSIALPTNTLTVGGILNITATAGAITGHDRLNVTGTTYLSGTDITLDDSRNTFGGDVTIGSGQNVALRSNQGLQFGTATVSGTLGVETNGNITQTGTMNVSGATTFTLHAAQTDIALADTSNRFAGTIATTTTGAGSLSDFTLYNTVSTGLQLTALSGNLQLTSPGVTQSTLLNVMGTSTFTITGGNATISLANYDNQFRSDLTFYLTGSNNNLYLRDLSSAARIFTYPNSYHDFTLETPNRAVSLHTLGLSGNLSVLSGGAIQQTGTIQVSGTSSFVTQGTNADVLLGTAGNALSGTISISASGGGSLHDVTLTNANDIAFNIPSMSGALVLTSGGDISQTGALQVTGTASFTSEKNGGTINLGSFDNNFGNTITFSAGAGGPLNDVFLRDVSGTARTLTFVPTSLRNLTLSFPNHATLLTNLPTLSGNLSVTSFGYIKQSGALTVGGSTTLTVTAAGSDVFLDDASNSLSGTVTVGVSGAGSLHDVILKNSGGLTLDLAPISNDLNVATGGSIGQSRLLSVGHNAVFALGGVAPSLSLGGYDNIFGPSLTISSTLLPFGNLSLRNVSLTATTLSFPSIVQNLTLDFPSLAIQLPATTVTGNLSVTAGQNITQAGALDVTGTTSLSTSTTADVNLPNASNNFRSTVGVSSSRDVTLQDSDSLQLGNITSRNLTLHAGLGINQAFATQLSVSGLITLIAGADIDLDNASNDFGRIVISGVAAHDVTLRTMQGLSFEGPSSMTGKLVVTTQGDVSQTSTLTVGTTASFATNNHDVTLTGANNFTGGVSMSSVHNADIHNARATILDSTNASGSLQLQSAGSITQLGALEVSGATTLTLTAGPADITLLNSANTFTGGLTLAQSSPGYLRNVSLVSDSSVALTAAPISGALTLTAGGAITQGGALNVTGLSTFTVTGAAADVTLDNASNVFTGGLVIAGSIHDLSLLNNTGAALTLPGTLHNLTVVLPSSGFALPTLTLTGALNVTAHGNITQTGAVSVGGDSQFTVTAAASRVTLNGANHFGGPGAIVVQGSGVGTLTDVTLVDDSAVNLQLGTMSGNLSVTSRGDITQASVLNVGGTSTFVVTGALNNVVLGNSANVFSGSISASAVGASASLQDFSLTNNSSSAQPLSFPSSLRNLTLVFPNRAIPLPALTLTGNLTVTSGGTISQTGVIDVSGLTSLTLNGANSNVLLGTTGNRFVGAVHVGTSGLGTLNNLQLSDSTAIDLDLPTLLGSLTVASGGAITQSQSLNVAGTSSFSLTSGTSDITLSNTANVFAGSLTIANAGGTVRDLNLANSSSAVSALVLPASLRNVTLSLPNRAVALPSVAASGTFSLTAGGNVTQSGPLDVTGAATFLVAPGFDVSLSNSANTFSGALTISNASAGLLHSVTISDDDPALALNLTPLSGNLVVTTGGSLTQLQSLQVAGTTSLTFTGASSDVTLTNSANRFDGTLSVATSGVGSLRNFALTDTNDLVLPALTLSGGLTITSGGSVSQAGKLTVAGASLFTATGTNADFLLNNPSNLFQGAFTLGVSGGSIRDFALVNLSTSVQPLNFPTTLRNLTLALPNRAVALPGLSITGALDVTFGGALTQTGALNVSGNTLLTTTAAGVDVDLSQAANAFNGTLTLTKSGLGSLHDVTLTDTSSLALDLAAVLGNLQVTAGGNITQSADLSVGGTTTLRATAASSDVTLTNASNAFTGAVSVSSSGALGSVRNLSLTTALPLTLGGTALLGDLTISSGGLAQTGAIDVAGNSVFTVTSANADLLLGNTSNRFVGSVAIATSGAGSLRNVTLADTTDLALPSLTLSGNLAVTSAGHLTQTGALVVAGSSSFQLTGSNKDLLLGNLGNQFVGTLTIGSSSGSVRDLTLADTSALALQLPHVTGNLLVTSGGALTQSTALLVDGTSRFVITATNTDVTLDNASNLFSGTVQFATTGSGSIRNLAFLDSDALSLDVAPVTGNLSVTVGGTLNQSSALAVGGTSQFTLTGSIVDVDLGLDNAFGSAITVATSGAGTVRDVTLKNISNTAATLLFPTSLRNLSLTFPNLAITLPSLSLTGNLTVSSGGAVTQNNGSTLLVAGTSSITSGSTSNIDLRSATNDFQGSVSIGQAQNVWLRDATAIQLGNVNAHDLWLRSGLGLSQAAATRLNLTGLLTVYSSSGDDITLDNTGNNFSEIDLALDPDTGTAPHHVTLRTSGPLAFVGGASFVNGNLAVVSDGDITQQSALNVLGTSSFFTNNHDLTLFDAANDFGGAVSIGSAHDVALRDVNTFTLGTTSITGSLHLAAASLDLNDNLTAAGITLDANTTLSRAGTQALDAGAHPFVVNGNLTKTTAGKLTLTGSLIDLNGSVVAPSGVTFNGPTFLQGDLTSLGIDLSALTLDGGNQTLDALSGVLTVTGILSKTTSGSLTLRGALLDLRSDLTAPGALVLDGPADVLGNISAQGITLLHDLRLLGATTQTINSGSGKLTSDTVLITKTNGSLVLAGAAGQLGSISATGEITDDLFTTALKGTWTASRINFSHGFSIAGDTTFNSPVSLGSGVDMGGHSLIFGGDVTLTRDADLLTGGGQLTFRGAIDGASGLTIDTGPGGNVNVLGDIGSVGPLTHFITTGGGTLHLGANVTTNGNSQLYGTIVVLDGKVILTEIDPTGSILFSRTLDASTPTAALVVRSPGTVKFSGAVGATGALASLSTDSGGTTILAGGSVSTRGAQTYGDTVQLAAATTLNSSGGKIDFAQIDGAHNNLTLAAGIGTGATTFRGAVTNLGSGTGAALTVADGVTGLLDFQGALATNSGLSASETSKVRFAGNVTLDNGDTGTHLRGEVSLGATNFSGYDGLEFGTILLTGGAVKVTAMDASDVRFTGTIDGAERLQVVASGANRFSGDIGSANALAALDVSGGGTLVVTGGIHTTGDQTFHDGLVLSGAGAQTLQSDGGRISSNGALKKDSATPLTLRAGASIAIDGDLTSAGAVVIDSADTRLASNVAVQGLTLTRALTLTGANAQTVSAGNGTLTAFAISKPTGAMTLSGQGAVLGGNIGTNAADLDLNFSTVGLASDVTITTANGKLSLAGTFSGGKALHLDSGSGDIAVTGALGTSDSPLASVLADGASVAVSDVITTGDQTYVYDRGRILLLNGNVYTAVSGNINLNTTNTPRTEIPAIATIAKPNSGNLTMTAGGDISMGLYEKFSVTNGSLTLHAGHTAVLSDLSVAGALEVQTDALRLLTRRRGSVRIEGGETLDLGLDFVAQSIRFANLEGTAMIAGGAIDFTHDSGERNFYVRFATSDGSANVPLLPGFSFYTLPASYFEGGQIGHAQFGPLDNLYLDLRAIGFNRANVGSALPPVTPPQPVHTNARVEVPAALRDDLVKLGIFARPDTELALQPADSHAPIYDATIKSEERSPEQFRVADTRISADEALATIRLYRAAFEERRGDGTVHSRVGEIQILLTTAFEQYQSEPGEHDPKGFRRFLESRGGPALQHLNQLRSLLVQIGRLGLTEEEFSISKTYVLRSIRVPGLPLHSLREAIEADSLPSAGKFLTSLDSVLRRAAP